MRLLGCKQVEGAHTEHIEAGVTTGAYVDGYNHDNGIVNHMSIHSKGINHWPPLHFPINHERHGEPSALIKVDQMLLGVMSPLLEYGVSVISFIPLIFRMQFSLNTDLQRMQHRLGLLGS